MSGKVEKKADKKEKVEKKETKKEETEPVEVKKPTKRTKSTKTKKVKEEKEKKERKRRDVSRESVDADFELLEEKIASEIETLRDSKEKNKGIKFLRSLSKMIKVLH